MKHRNEHINVSGIESSDRSEIYLSLDSTSVPSNDMYNWHQRKFNIQPEHISDIHESNEHYKKKVSGEETYE